MEKQVETNGENVKKHWFHKLPLLKMGVLFAVLGVGSIFMIENNTFATLSLMFAVTISSLCVLGKSFQDCKFDMYPVH